MHYVFGLSACPSIHPKPEIPSFHLYMGSLVHPTNRHHFTTCPSVHPDRFPCISCKTHKWNGLKFCILKCPDQVQNLLDNSHGLLIFLLLMPLWLNETASLGSLGISRRMHIGNGMKFCTLMCLNHLHKWLDYGLGMLIFLLLTPLSLSEIGQILCFQKFPGKRIRDLSEMLHADVFWPHSELVRFVTANAFVW